MAHIISMIVAVLIALGLYFALKNKTEKVKILVLGILSFSGCVAIIYNLIKWESPLEYLPFHLCSLNAIALPIAVFSKNKILNNLLLLWAIGALCAIVINSAQAEYEIFSFTFIIYYFPHVLEFIIPVLMFALKIVKKDFRCIISTMLITFVAYTIIHFINVGLNNYFVSNNILDNSNNLIQVNYMFSILPENPVLDIFYKIIPHSYWYMLLAVPVVIIYLLVIYLRQIKEYFKSLSFKKNNNLE